MPTIRERFHRFRQMISRQNRTTPPTINENPPQLPPLPENEDSAIGPREIGPREIGPREIGPREIGPREHSVIQEHPLQLASGLADRRAEIRPAERREFVQGATEIIRDLEASFHQMRRMMRLPIRMSHIDIRLFYAAMLERHATFENRIDRIMADYRAYLNIEGRETQQRNPLETIGNRPENRLQPEPQSEPEPEPEPELENETFSVDGLEPGERVTLYMHLPPHLGWTAFAGMLETMARDLDEERGT